MGCGWSTAAAATDAPRERAAGKGKGTAAKDKGGTEKKKGAKAEKGRAAPEVAASSEPAVPPPPSAVKKPAVGPVLGKPLEDVKALYTIGRELGRGQFGVTYLCTDKATGEQYACKSIAKRKLVTKEDLEDVKREVAIMNHLAGHPNIVEVKGSFEDKHNVHIVMELCAGGELFDRIIQRGHYSERAAAALLRTIVSVVEFCHANNVMHRDLKPENFLLANKKEDAPLKTTDFGLSVFFTPGETFSDIVGSAYYVAPEVLKRAYGKEADVWSCGVILYILLCGVPPFWAESEQAIFDAVQEGHLDFESDPWPHISTSAKELVKRMLTQDPAKRIPVHQVLSHPWVREGGEASDLPLDPAVLSKLKQFSAMNKLKKMALKFIASHLSEEEILGLKEMFKDMDQDGSGSITFEELRDGLRRYGSALSEDQVRKLMDAADVDKNGEIDYDEFVTATMNMNKAQKEETLYEAFRHFDTDGSGTITADELKSALLEEGNLLPGEIDSILEEVDTDKDGTIDFSEFVAMMKKGNPTFETELGHTKKKR